MVREQAYTSLLQGVSQQLPKDRLPGQVTKQLNMLSDVVTGMRRRPGAEIKANIDIPGEYWPTVHAEFLTIGDQDVHVIIGTNTGTVILLDRGYTEITRMQADYLIAMDVQHVRTAVVGSEMYILNTEKHPALVTPVINIPMARRGFFYVPAGAFGKEYRVTVDLGFGTAVGTYSTPDGTGANDAAQASPAYIAEQLLAGLSGSIGDSALAISTGQSIVSSIEAVMRTLENPRSPGYPLSPNLVWNTLKQFSLERAQDALVDTTAGDYASAADLLEDAYDNLKSFEFEANNAPLHMPPTNGAYDPAVQAALSALQLGISYNQSLRDGIPIGTPGALPFGLQAWRDEAFVYIEAPASALSMSVESSTGTTYLITSRKNYATSEGLLPNKLPVQADGLIMRVGNVRLPVYYKYSAADVAWLESGDELSPTGLSNMPITLRLLNTTWFLEPAVFEGRLAGDDESNPNPAFIETGITGISSYQSRLVLLSGPYVNMSATNNSTRFYRSTVASLVDDDCIEIGSAAIGSARFEWAAQFNKDLVLFSFNHQAVIPANNQAVTPRTAAVIFTSSNNADVTCAPVSLGRTMLYPVIKSDNFYGIFEMVPNQYTDAQYTSTDATSHIPKYLKGKCRGSTVNSAAEYAMFLSTDVPKTVYVHEYVWGADQKLQQAWHEWEFPYEVVRCYFSYDAMNVLFLQNEVLCVCSLDIRAGNSRIPTELRPYLDMHVQSSISDNTGSIPDWLSGFDSEYHNKLKGSNIAIRTDAELFITDYAGEEMGLIEWNSYSEFTIDESWGVQSNMYLGIPYQSELVLTPPVVFERGSGGAQGNPVLSNKVTVLRFLVHTNNSKSFYSDVYDALYVQPNDPLHAPVLYWCSPELSLGSTRTAYQSNTVIPARINAGTAHIGFLSAGVGEMNIVHVEYVLRTNAKIRR